MHRDIKIGLVLGLVLVIVVMLRIATDPRLSPEARIGQLHKSAPQENSISENDVLNKSWSAIEQKDLSYDEPAENRITQYEPEADIPDIIETATEFTGNNDISAFKQIQDKSVTEIPDSSKYELTEKIQTQKFHIVQKDETLSGISQQYYGTANKWKTIYDFNRNVIEDPNKIRSGIKLIIPNL